MTADSIADSSAGSEPDETAVDETTPGKRVDSDGVDEQTADPERDDEFDDAELDDEEADDDDGDDDDERGFLIDPASLGEAGRMPDHPRCGFVALVGAPNAGKSTLLNALVGAKIAIVSPKVQTTRSKVLGIATEGDSQILFVDLPGIFTPHKRLERAMVAAAWQGAADADMVLVLFDAAQRGIDPDTRGIVERLKDGGRRAILVLNKIDLIRRDRLLALTEEFAASGVFDHTFMVSATSGDGLKDLLRFLAGAVPEGPWLYPEDQLSDMPQRLLAAEVTREKVFLQLHQELPYAITVETESWETLKDGSAKIMQVIYVQRDSQKAIVLGKGGARIKQIGASSRHDLEKMLEGRVHLFLFVKVREGWTDDPERYETWGLDFNAS